LHQLIRLYKLLYTHIDIPRFLACPLPILTVRDHEKLQIIWLITSYWVPLIRQECNKLAIFQKVRKHGHVLLKLLPSQSYTEENSLILPDGVPLHSANSENSCN